jgi:sulfur relay (sulfurtransferase) complex TusBCD TusD component (DsrE family)
VEAESSLTTFSLASLYIHREIFMAMKTYIINMKNLCFCIHKYTYIRSSNYFSFQLHSCKPLRVFPTYLSKKQVLLSAQRNSTIQVNSLANAMPFFWQKNLSTHVCTPRATVRGTVQYDAGGTAHDQQTLIQRSFAAGW